MKRILFVSLFVLVSCSNPYMKFYQGAPDARIFPSYISSNEELKIYSFNLNETQQNIKYLKYKGYMLIGESSFIANSNSVTQTKLRQQARKIGAHVVLVSSTYSNTISGIIPLTLPNRTTSYTTGNAIINGPGGTATAYGSGTTTTYSTQTTYLPYTVNRSEFHALYFCKLKFKIGVFIVPLDEETRKKIESNSGIFIDVVVEGSPAFEANILPGDILLAINGVTVKSVEHFNELLDNYPSETVEFELNRDGRIIQKVVPVRKL